ncbi:response regulator [Amycolatopsis japonica]|uniref:response regulator n=1 Tax=Amycolatopsis japonica TaxID=208439 RepID=UPI00366AC466
MSFYAGTPRRRYTSMPRGEKPLDMARGPVAEFAAELRALRRVVGTPTYRTLAGRANYSITVLSQAAAGVTVPAWPVVKAFILACGGDLLEWEQRWQAMCRAQEAHDVAAAQPPPSEPPVSEAFQVVRDAQVRQINDSQQQAAPAALKVFLLDDHELVRTGLRALLESEPDMIVIGEAATAAEAKARIPVLKPDVAILDIRLPDGNGIEICRFVRSTMEPPPACMMLTSYTDEDAMITAIHAGAAAYLIKDIRGEDVIAAVRYLASGKSMLDPRAVASAMKRLRGDTAQVHLNKLSAQERNVLDLIAAGLTNKQIAQQLFLSEKTVRNYVSSILTKLGLETRSSAAVFVQEQERRRNNADALKLAGLLNTYYAK